MTHHKTWFPLIVVALTALLGLFIYSVFADRVETSARPTPITEAAYQAEVQSAVGTLQAEFDAASSDAERLARAQKAREDLLQLRVPSGSKDRHLEMVMILTEWIAGFQGDDTKRFEAEARWQALDIP